MAREGSARRTLPAPLLLVAIPLLALVALVSWGFASPVGAGPDDDFHLTSIWCGGAPDDGCQPGTQESERRVPPALTTTAVCYANDSAQSAACQGPEFGDDLTELVLSDRGNFTGLYPPVYYFSMSLFSGADLEVSALTMRVVNSVLFVGMVTTLFHLLPRPRRSTLVISLLVTMVPLGMFLVPSNNPSGWAVLSAATLWIALLGFFETTGRRRVALGAFAALAVVIGAGARADSAIYAVIAVAAVVLLKARLDRRSLLLLILPVVLCALAVGLFLSAGQSSAVSSGLTGDGEQLTLYELIVQNALQVPDLWRGVFGSWPLGWLDTPLPAVVSFAAFGAFCAAMIIGFGLPYLRKALAAGMLLVAVLAVPTAILFQSNALVGAQVQPRYILPLVIVLAGVALLQPAGVLPTVSRAQLLIVATALGVANAVALHSNIRRYVTGTDATAGNLDAGAEWWWQIPVSPMGVWFIGSVAFAGMLALLVSRWWARARRDQDADADRGREPVEVSLERSA